MTILNVTVTTRTMPHTSEFFGVTKAVERIYYALLLSTLDSYQGQEEPWQSWVEQGFSLAIRQPPPGTDPEDALITSVRSRGKIIEITASSEHQELLDQGAGVLEAVEVSSIAGPSEPSPTLQQLLQDPVAEAMRASGVATRTQDAVNDSLSKALGALTYRDVTSIEAALQVTAALVG